MTKLSISITSFGFALFVGLFVVFLFIRRMNYRESYRESIKACADAACWWVLLFSIFFLCVSVSFWGALHFFNTFL